MTYLEAARKESTTSVKEAESSTAVLEAELAKLDATDPHANELRLQTDHSRKETMIQLDAWDTVYLTHHPKRPKAADHIRVLFPGFMELHGDRYYGDDAACQGGIATFHGRSVTVLTQSKGKTLEENIQRNFGILHPEDYCKAIRLAKQAEKFHRPVITLVDTAGAYLGKGAEERGQAEAIAQCPAVPSEIRIPVLTIVLSEGGSGGALALSIADHTMILEYAIYSVLSPGGFASTLWEDEFRATEAAGVMELMASDLKREGVIDTVIVEPKDDAYICFDHVVEHLREQPENVLDDLCKKKEKVLPAKRYEKHRVAGANYEELQHQGTELYAGKTPRYQ